MLSELAHCLLTEDHAIEYFMNFPDAIPNQYYKPLFLTEGNKSNQLEEQYTYIDPKINLEGCFKIFDN
jgi:hypothetical protein